MKLDTPLPVTRKIAAHRQTASPRRALLRALILAASASAVIGIFASPAVASQPLSWAAPTTIDASPGPSGLQSISCPSASLCVAGDSAGNIVTSTTPTVAGSWSVASVDTFNIFGISCPSVSLCVAVDGAGKVLTSTSPTSSWSAPATVDSGHALESVSCSSATLCVAGDNAGNVVSTITPTTPASWAVTHVDGASFLLGMSCYGTESCVGVGSSGNVVRNPTATDATKWSTTASAVDGNGFRRVACDVNSQACVAGDNAGNVVTGDATNPSAWSTANVDGANTLRGLSCFGMVLCVAGDDAGNVVASTDPTGGSTKWSATHVDGTNTLNAISCPSSSLCVAVDSAGKAVVGTPSATPWTLTVSMAGTGQGAVTDSNGFTCSTASGTSCTHNYATGQPVQLTAAGAPGNDFTSWAGCDSVVGNQCNTTMNADHQVTATFTRTRHNLTVAVDLAGTGSGTITTADGIDCGVPSSGHSVCVKQYADGAHALMTAHPVDNATVSWSGECTPTGNTCDATIGPDKSVTATFTKNSSVADGGSGIASGGTGGSLGAGSLGTGAQSAPPAGSATNSGSSSQTSSAAGSFTTGIATQCTVPSGCSVGASATTTVPTGSAATKGKKKTTAVMLGSTKLHLTNGQRALVKIKLSQRGLRILKRLGHLKVRVTVNIRSGGSRSVVINRTITLKAPKKKH